MSSGSCGKQSGEQPAGKREDGRHMQIPELFSLEMCDETVMDFLAATEAEKFTRR
jgi:hypothetical protein